MNQNLQIDENTETHKMREIIIRGLRLTAICISMYMVLCVYMTMYYSFIHSIFLNLFLKMCHIDP